MVGQASIGNDWYKDAQSFAEDFNVNIIDINGDATPLNITYSDIKTVFDDISDAFTFTDFTLTFSGDKRSDGISFNFDDTVLPSGIDHMNLDFYPVGWAAFDDYDVSIGPPHEGKQTLSIDRIGSRKSNRLMI